jgi:hypothetical protein
MTGGQDGRGRWMATEASRVKEYATYWAVYGFVKARALWCIENSGGEMVSEDSPPGIEIGHVLDCWPVGDLPHEGDGFEVTAGLVAYRYADDEEQGEAALLDWLLARGLGKAGLETEAQYRRAAAEQHARWMAREKARPALSRCEFVNKAGSRCGCHFRGGAHYCHLHSPERLERLMRVWTAANLGLGI